MKTEDQSREVGLPQRFNFMTPGNYQPQDKPCHMGHRNPFARVVFTGCGLALLYISTHFGANMGGEERSMGL